MAIRLSPLEPRHAGRVALWELDPAVASGLLRPLGPASVGEVMERASAPSRDRVHYIIEVTADRVDRLPPVCPVGFLTLAEGVDRVRWGSFEIALGVPWQGRGWGRRALEQVPGLLMAWRGLEAIKVGVFEDNARATGLYRSLGYEVVERSWLESTGGRRRALMMSNRPDLFKKREVGFSFGPR